MFGLINGRYAWIKQSEFCCERDEITILMDYLSRAECGSEGTVSGIIYAVNLVDLLSERTKNVS